MIERAIAKHLDSTVTGLTWSPTGGNIFLNEMPSTPDIAVGIFGSGGLPQLTRDPYDLPTVQIRVRGLRNDRMGPSVLAADIASQLQCLDGVVLDEGGDDETYVVGTDALQSASVDIGRDSSQRFERTQNFLFHTHAPTAHRT